MLPMAFSERMRALLGQEAPAFFQALEAPAVRGLRLNRTKAAHLTVEDLELSCVAPIPYTRAGYIFCAEGIGHTPLHHAGAFYVQDPGAMSAVCALPLRPGMRVLDLCAAPGGKSTQLADAVGEEGLVISNEYVPARTKILCSNIERLGIRNAVVTQVDTAALPRWFCAYFDAVVADVPCSGEGMFRKDNPAITEWSPENIARCKERARGILDNAAPLVRDGGYLLFSTCTYAPEENEEQLQDFLSRHTDFTLIPPAESVRDRFCSGLTSILEHGEHAKRFYPHKDPGEGQFFAVMQRKTDDLPRILYKNSFKPLTKEEETAANAFIKATLTLPEDCCLSKLGERIYVHKRELCAPPFGVWMAGVALGELRGRTLVPHHQLFSAYGHRFLRKAELSEQELKQYLHGEQLPCALPDGYCAVTVRGVPLGGGKVSGGQMKNHYPKGLRTP